jgi:hypothetical protein
LTLKLDLPGQARPLNLGYLTKTGQLWTENVVASASPSATAAAMAYLDAVAAMIGGSVKFGTQPYATTNGASAPTIDQLLKSDAAWRTAIETFVAAARHTAEQLA